MKETQDEEKKRKIKDDKFIKYFPELSEGGLFFNDSIADFDEMLSFFEARECVVTNIDEEGLMTIVSLYENCEIDEIVKEAEECGISVHLTEKGKYYYTWKNANYETKVLVKTGEETEKVEYLLHKARGRRRIWEEKNNKVIDIKE